MHRFYKIRLYLSNGEIITEDIYKPFTDNPRKYLLELTKDKVEKLINENAKNKNVTLIRLDII